MQSANQLPRPNLSGDLATSLRAMIFDGRLVAGARVNEVQLAASLGVSRTPLREALIGLVAEGALTAIPRRGFFVCDLTAEEAARIYPIRAILDPEGLRLAGVPSPDRLARLETVNAVLGTAADVELAIRLDENWHRELWADCPNPVLIELIEQFMRRTRRYELASMRQQATIRKSTESKAAIVELLRAGDLARACRKLRKSLESGLVPVLEWLSQRDRGRS